jgi:hypothetical protein
MRATVTATMLDGSTQTVRGEMAPLTDRVAFERQFHTSATVLSRLADMFDENGRLRDEADPAALREEWTAFLSWRMLARANPEAFNLGFEGWLEQVSEVALDVTEEEVGEEVPTATAAAPITS